MKPSARLYTLLGQESALHVEGRSSQGSQGKSPVLFLILSNFVLLVMLGAALISLLQKDKLVPTPSGFAITEELPTTYGSFTWWTEYSGANDTEVDALWNAILPSHGLVAVDREWSKQRNWPDSLHLPTDNSKNIYLLEAYHQLHCVKIIRQTFWEAVRRQPYTPNPPHAGHCFDFLRQLSAYVAYNALPYWSRLMHKY